eukprot:COSAG01_NODE_24507_length_776_cov_2.096012_1_plen_48_part_10
MVPSPSRAGRAALSAFLRDDRDGSRDGCGSDYGSGGLVGLAPTSRAAT